MNEESQLESTPAQEKGIVVFIVRRDTQCFECKRELWHGSFIRLLNGQPLCLDCADLDHLEYLPRGDAALTRRATKYSPLHAVVVQWSRSRKRYERQGILVAAEAVERAEQECLADAELRERRRQRAGEQRAMEDEKFHEAFAQAIRQQFPGCPVDEATIIARHACQKHSGRVGRTAAAKELDPTAIRLAVIARIRHAHTPYDEILMRTDDRALARSEVQAKIERVREKWEKS